MEKVLIIGSKSTFMNSLEEELSEDYIIHSCTGDITSIQRAGRLFQPKVAVYVKTPLSEVSTIKQIRNEFKETALIVILEKDDDSMNQYKGIKPICLQKPFLMSQLSGLIAEIASGDIVVKLKYQILAVDDDGLVLRNIKEMVGDNYDLDLATSGERALELIEKNEYDLVLLDYEMPGKNGYEVFRDIERLKRNKAMPVVFLTAVSERQKIVEVLAHHPAGYLLKPIDNDVLQQTISSVLGE